MNEQQVVMLMKSSKSLQEWNANLEEVKRKCGGYPEFWYGAVVASGLAEETAAKFGETAELRVTKVGG